ncbi:MAG: hypothetical protein ACJ8EE_07360 [Bradyrhizobium sp.]
MKQGDIQEVAGYSRDFNGQGAKMFGNFTKTIIALEHSAPTAKTGELVCEARRAAGTQHRKNSRLTGR